MDISMDIHIHGNPGFSLCGGILRHWRLSTTAIVGDLGGYVFENFRDTASSNM